MIKKIPIPKISEVLKEDFMEPLNLSKYKLAKLSNISVSIIQDILNNKIKINKDTAIKFSIAFGTSIDFWLKMQADIDSREIYSN